MTLSLTAQKMLDAYGGAELWGKARHVRAEVSAHGLAFTLKRRPPFRKAQITCDVTRPFTRLTPIGQRADVAGVLDGEDVRLEQPDGTVLETRQNARSFFPGGRRIWRWDDLDMAYFAGYAFWNYLCLPALLLRPDIRWEECAPGHLRAHFPSKVPSHSPMQDFHIDMATGRLLQHDYAAEVISELANAANVITGHDEQDGLTFANERRVTPRGFNGAPLPAPLLIYVKIHQFSVESEADTKLTQRPERP